MAIQSATVNGSGNQFFNRLPDEVVSHIFEYLKGEKSSLVQGDDRAIMATARVCRNWQNNILLREERQETSTWLRLENVHLEMTEGDYPLTMRQMFRHYSMPIAKLPVLDLNMRDPRDYIDYLNPEDLSDPVMRFTAQGRPGIAFSLQCRTMPPLTLMEENFREENPEEFDLIRQDLPLPTQVLAIFKRFATPDSRWTFANNRGIEFRTPGLAIDGHIINREFIEHLLADRHPLHRIISVVDVPPQVALPLPDQ